MSVIQKRGLAIYKKLDTNIQDIIDYYIQLNNKRINNWLNLEIREIFELTYEFDFPYFDEYPDNTENIKYCEYYEKMKNENGYINSIVYSDPHIPMEFVIHFIKNIMKTQNTEKYNYYRETIEWFINVDIDRKYPTIRPLSLYCYKEEKLFIELKEVLDKINKNKIQSILCEYDTELQKLINKKEVIQNRTNMIWELQQYITLSNNNVLQFIKNK